MRAQSFFLAVIVLASSNVTATDIAREIQNSGYGRGSFAELGFALGASSEPLIGFNDQTLEESGDTSISLTASLEGRLEYKRAFIEFIENSFSSVALGFNAFSTKRSNHEIVVASLFSGVSRNGVTGFETIKDRDADVNLGFRSSYYIGDSIAQVELVSDVSGTHGGVIGTLQFGHQTQVRNWSLHALTGLRYFTDNVIDEQFGVSAVEATDALPVYRAGDGLMPTLQLGATLPINEKWIFRANAEYTKYPSAVVDSPLAQGDSSYFLSTGIYYVLYGN